MKKFFLKTSLLLLILTLIFFVLNFAYRNTNYWKSENDVYKLSYIPDGIELAAIGSSHVAMHFKFDAVPEVKGFNFGMKGEMYNYDYKMLKQFHHHFKENATVILMIEHPEIIQRSGIDPSMKAAYYRILDKENIENYSFKENLVFNLLPILSAKSNIWKIFSDIKKEDMILISSPKVAKPYLPDEETLNYRADYRYKSWRNADDPEKGFNENFSDLSKMIDFCLEHNFRPVLVASPLSAPLNKLFDEDETFTAYYKKFTKKILEKYPDLKFFNYTHDQDYQSDLLLFSDALEHLNTKGAEVFTQKVVKDLKENNLL